ncbi:MAG: hypothetical protein JXO49_03500 [Deltaproteobacteria bacterium]|nr:hypothetical protein [Candidatus Anaeroferrophillus wilburensis]MBN2888393.1 hypothetical protein [Deltaproteobacteria bacterium]
MRKTSIILTVAALVIFLAGAGVIHLAKTAAAETDNPLTVKSPSASRTTNTIIAYYFHGNRRCSTCRKIESYTLEALQEHFAKELSSGLLVWRPVNTDQREHEHFVKEFKLTNRAVVLVNMVDGRQTRWQNLDRIWTMVRNQAAFKEYVQLRTRNFMDEKQP